VKASALLATAALSSLFALSASAEQYQGVPRAFASTLDRTAVRAQARATAAHGVTEGTL
jgi:hypothetical protein